MGLSMLLEADGRLLEGLNNTIVTVLSGTCVVTRLLSLY